jgi:imidazolonepropionase
MLKHFINSKKIYGLHEIGIKKLTGSEMNHFPSLDNGYITVENGIITDIGRMDYFNPNSGETIDLQQADIFPCYCDSHTHIVFAEPREAEFEMKIQGKTYEEIAAAGGGIVNSAAKLALKSEEELFHSASERLKKLMKIGTGAIEVKSGYGLSIDAEIKMLRVIKRLKETFPIPIKSTFLGAHAVPKSFKSNLEYIQTVIFPCLEIIEKEQLADYIDIFIEKNYFTIEDSKIILERAKKIGLMPKLHVNQLSNQGALQFAVDENALSADHLEEMTETEILYLKDKKTIGTLLPSCSFFIKIPYAPARKMIDSGLAIALASDFNPGSTPSGNMNFVVSLACIYQKMLPNEALNAATLNGAYAMELQDEVGSIAIGKRANFFTSKNTQSVASIPYSFGMPLIDEVYINGNLIKE